MNFFLCILQMMGVFILGFAAGLHPAVTTLAAILVALPTLKLMARLNP